MKVSTPESLETFVAANGSEPTPVLQESQGFVDDLPLVKHFGIHPLHGMICLVHLMHAGVEVSVTS